MKVHELKNKTFCTDLEKTISLCKAKNIFFGAHIDSHAKHTETGCTGCGAIDKIPDIFSKMLAPEFKVAVAPYLEAILGDTYAEHRAHEMLTRIALLQKSGGEYFEHETGGVYNYRTKTIEGIRNGAEKVAAIEELVGDHREVALVVNKVKGWTFDRDRFAQDHGVQAFNYDYWVSEKFASQLFDTEEERKEFLTVRAMLAVATAMVLTDGSIELVVRS